MANLDFTPLFRSSVGFDRLPRMLQTASQVGDANAAYPPYDIEKTGDDEYRIVVALAGFSADDIDIIVEQNRLTIRGKISDREGVNYLHRGIAGRSFERLFDLADFIEVGGAAFENGLLTIDLRREIPERLKPRHVEINGASQPKSVKTPKKNVA